MTGKENEKQENKNNEWHFLKWEEFKLNTDKVAPFELPPIRSEKEEMKNIQDINKMMLGIIKKEKKKIEKQKEICIVETIIDIYNHKYANYEVYLSVMKALTNKARENNTKIFYSKEDAPKQWYIEPVIFSKNIFNTAYKLGGKRGNK